MLSLPLQLGFPGINISLLFEGEGAIRRLLYVFGSMKQVENSFFDNGMTNILGTVLQHLVKNHLADRYSIYMFDQVIKQETLIE